MIDSNIVRQARIEVLNFMNNLDNQKNVDKPADWRLKDLASSVALQTKYGSFAFSSNIRSRSAANTVYIGHPRVQLASLNAGQKNIINNVLTTLKEVHTYLKKAPLLKISRTMGNNDFYSPKCSLYFSLYSKEKIRIPYMWSKSLFPEREGSTPHLRLVYVPEWPAQKKQILVFPEIGVTYVLGSDYFGEAKKGFLRMAMWFAKLHGMIGLHVGTKLVRGKDAKDGKLKTYAMVIFGLSGTGKTTHTCHNHYLDDSIGEGVWICQDDFPILKPDGGFLGTEKGFFIKTDSLTAESQPLLYNAALKPHAVFENVLVDYTGDLHFLDETLSGNGRGIIQWADMGKYKSETVNTPSVSEIDGIIFAINTRRHDVVPIVSKLTREQLAAFFALGESVRTAADDPTKVGESVRVVGTDPFIIGNEAKHINKFYDIIMSLPEDKVQGFLLNTGGTGELFEGEGINRKKTQKVLRIEIVEMANIIKNIIRNNIEWIDEPVFGTKVPKKIENVDLDKFNPLNYYDKNTYERLIKTLKNERSAYFDKFEGLYPEIKKSINL